MSERGGLYNLLRLPWAYSFQQRLVGAANAARYFVEQYARPLPGDRILDIGCGPGGLLDFLPAGVEYHGLDPNPGYVSLARERCQSRGRFHVAGLGPGGDLLIPDAVPPCNIVLCQFVFHHLAEPEALALIRTARRLLQDQSGSGQARFVVSDNCLDQASSRASRWLIRRDRGRHPRNRQWYEENLRGAFPKTRMDVFHKLLRMPYTLIMAECRLE